jgi:hypothetical protein
MKFVDDINQKTEEEQVDSDSGLTKKEKNRRRGEIWLDKIYNSRLYFEPYRYQSFIANKKYMSENYEFDLARIFYGDTDIGFNIDMREVSARMNMFYTTVKTQKASILPEIPRVIIRKTDLKEFYGRTDKTKFFNCIEQLIGAVLKYFSSPDIFDPYVFECFKLDYFITGQGVLWVNHFFRTHNSQRPNQDLSIEHVRWYDYTQDIKFRWQDVQWVARRKILNRTQFELNFPECDIKKMNFYDYAQFIESPWQDRDFFIYQNFLERSGDKWCILWEIWDKERQRSLYVSDGYEDRLLLQRDLHTSPEYVLPCPRPAIHVLSSFDMMPRSEMWSYWHELDELSKISYRKADLIDSIQATGFVDSKNNQLVEKLNDPRYCKENFIMPVSQLPEDGQAIHYIDNTPKQKVIEGLDQQVPMLQSVIYTLSGINELQRAFNEQAQTKSATDTRISSRFGNMPLQHEQRQLNTYIRNVFKIILNKVCQHFDKDTLQKMTSLNFRSQSEVQKDLQVAITTEKKCEAQVEKLYEEAVNLQKEMTQLFNPQSQFDYIPSLRAMREDNEKMQPNPHFIQAQQEQANMQNQQQPMEGAGGPPQENSEQAPQTPPEEQQQGGGFDEVPEGQGNLEQNGLQLRMPDMQQAMQRGQQIDQQQRKVLQDLEDMVVHGYQARTEKELLEMEITWEQLIRYLRKNDLVYFTLEVDTNFDNVEGDPALMQTAMQTWNNTQQMIMNTLPFMQQNPLFIDLGITGIKIALSKADMTREMRGQIEDVLYKLGEQLRLQARNPQQPQPDPNMIKAQAAQMDAQTKAQLAQAQMQKLQAEAQELMQQIQQGPQEQANDMQKHQMKIEADNARAEAKISSDTNKIRMQIAADKEKYHEKNQSDLLNAQIKTQSNNQSFGSPAPQRRRM